MKKKKYVVPNVGVRKSGCIVSPIMASGDSYKMKTTSDFFESGEAGSCSEPIFKSGGFSIGGNDKNDNSFGGGFGHGLWN